MSPLRSGRVSKAGMPYCEVWYMHRNWDMLALGVRTLTNAANVVKRVTIRGLVPTLAKTVLSSSSFLVKKAYGSTNEQKLEEPAEKIQTLRYLEEPCA